MGIIIGIIIAVLAIVAFVLGGSMFEYENNPLVGGISIIVGVALVIAFIIVPFSIHTVDTGEVAVVKNLGKIKTIRDAGTYYDFWMTNKYVKYDTKVQNLSTATAAYSADAQAMDIQMTIQYQIAGDKVKDIATQYGSLKILESRIQSIALEKAKSVLSSHKAMDIIAKRGSISPDVEKAIKDAVGDEYFVDIVTVVLENIDFSDAFELAVEEKMIAEQAKLKADYENETKIAKAEADAAAKLKEAEAKIDIAKAEAEALKISSEAEAAANKTIAESLTNAILDKLMADKWNGELPKVVGDGEYLLPSNILD